MIYLLAILVAVGSAVVFSRYLEYAGRSHFRKPALWACVAVGAAGGWVSYTHSTNPSLAPRITLTGKALDCLNVHRFSRNRHLFRFDSGSGDRIFLQTKIFAPMCFDSSKTFDDRTYRITYLDDARRSMSHEVTRVEVMSGTDAGWYRRLDARPFGAWLGVPVGAFLAALGALLLRMQKQQAAKESAA